MTILLDGKQHGEHRNARHAGNLLSYWYWSCSQSSDPSSFSETCKYHPLMGLFGPPNVWFSDGVYVLHCRILTAEHIPRTLPAHVAPCAASARCTFYGLRTPLSAQRDKW